MVRPLLYSFLLGAAWLPQAVWGTEQGAYKIPYDELKAASQKYLDALCPPKELAQMRKKLAQRVETRVQDSGADEDRIMREIMLDWAAGNEGSIRRKDPQAVRQACFYFIRFIEKNFLMPWQLRERLDEKACKEMMDYLNGEAEKAGKGQPAQVKKKDD